MSNTTLTQYILKLEQAKGRLEGININIEEAKDAIKKLKKDIIHTEEAKTIIQLVAKKTQEELEYRLAELVSLSMSAVFNEAYELKVSFVIRRDKTECDLVFMRGGEEFDPMTESGGGVVDVASFALRVALWSLSQPRTRNVLILDEPFRFLSTDLQRKASLVLKELSRRLDLQMIIVSHSKGLIEGADKVFKVSRVNGISKITEE